MPLSLMASICGSFALLLDVIRNQSLTHEAEVDMGHFQ